MTLALGLALYFIIWWTTLFAVLPWGVRTQDEEGVVVPGTPESAPARPRLIKVVVLNTVVATIVFAMVWAAIVYKLIPIEDLPLGRQ
jgi:predicted secreted protein